MKLSTCLTLFGLTACLSSPLTAQMSGSYAIDPFGTGARNFTTFDKATQALLSRGVSGPVELVVAPGNYPGWSLNAPIPGASTSNPVTFRSAIRWRARINSDTNQGVSISVRKPSFVEGVIVDGFDFFRNTCCGSSLSATGKGIEVRYCRFEGQLSIGGEHTSVHHCTFHGGNSIQLSSASSFEFHHNVIPLDRSPLFQFSGSQTGTGAPRSRVFNNLIYGEYTRTPAYPGAISLPPNTDFEHNTVHITAGSTNSGASQTVIQVNSTTTRPSVVRNNILVHDQGGVLIRADATARVDHNLYFAPLSSLPFAGTHGTLAQWRAASGHDVHSQVADPMFANAYDFRILPGSPAASNGGPRPSHVTDDLSGTTRPDPPSIGAYEGIPGTLFHNWGRGCAGSFGNVPEIGYTGLLAMGSTDFTVTLRNALGGPGQQAFFAAGASRSTISFGGGCDLLVSPDLVIGLSMGGASGPGTGTASVKISLPNAPNLKGTMVHFQWGVGDPAATGIGVAFSNGATLTL